MTQTHDFTPVEGQSFPVAIKLLATVGMGGLLMSAWGARTQLAAMPLPPDLLWLAGLAAARHQRRCLVARVALAQQRFAARHRPGEAAAREVAGRRGGAAPGGAHAGRG